MLPCPVRSPCRITQHYDGRPEFYRQYGQASHAGLDLTGPQAGVSVAVYSPVEGKVTKAGPDGDLGLCVRVLTAPNFKGEQREVVLGHLKTVAVRVGDVVPQMEVVGMMGTTGNSAGVHVHWAHRLWKDGRVQHAKNGNKGWLPFGTKEDPEAYVLFWGDPKALKLVTYPYG